MPNSPTSKDARHAWSSAVVRSRYLAIPSPRAVADPSFAVSGPAFSGVVLGGTFCAPGNQLVGPEQRRTQERVSVELHVRHELGSGNAVRTPSPR